MLVSDFQAKYICCHLGKMEGLKYETMKEWWYATYRGDWLRWAWYVDCRLDATGEELREWCHGLGMHLAPRSLVTEMQEAILCCGIEDANQVRSVMPCPR